MKSERKNSGNWFAVPHSITSHELKLSANARVLFVSLLACENRFSENPGDWFFTFNEQLQPMCGFGSESTLKRAKAELEKAGFISTAIRQRRISPRLVKTTMYYRINHGFVKSLSIPESYQEKTDNYTPDEELPF